MKYKRLVAFGDSFTYGSDLADCDQITIGEKILNKPAPSLSTWPALLADHLNLEYYCRARPGSSNSSILRSILSTELFPTDMVVVNWTWIDRVDYYDQYGWTTIRPTGTEEDPRFKLHYMYLQSELSDKLETLKNMHVALSNLDNVLTTSIDPLAFDTKHHCPPYIQKLIDRVEPALTWFNNRSFYQWSVDNKFKISAGMHPLEDAHRAAFEYIRDSYEIT